MNKTKAAILVSVLMAVILLFSCDLSGDSDSSENSNPSGVDFTSHNTNYSILVRNNTGERLVAFKGDPGADTLIGGILAHAQNHGLPKNPARFGNTNEGFALVLVTVDQYNANKNNLSVLKNTPFTRIYAFYNANGTNELPYEISGKLGGSCTIQIQNLSPLDVELRLNSIHGETLGYARNQSLNTTLYVNPGDYHIFPVFVKYNAMRDELTRVYPKGATGLPWHTQRALGEDNQMNLSLNVTEILEDQTYSTGTAWLIINNQATDTGVQLQRGGTVQLTPMGIATINNGYPRTFMIEMAKVPGTEQYAASANINAYTVGTAGHQINIGNHDLNVDTIYQVTVTGSLNAGTLAVSAPVVQGTVDLSDFTSTP